MTVLHHSVSRQNISGDEMEFAPHVTFSDCVKTYRYGHDGDRPLADGSDLDFSDLEYSCSYEPISTPRRQRFNEDDMSPVRSNKRPQLKRSDALEPDFREPSSHGGLERQHRRTSRATKSEEETIRRRPMLKRSNAFDSY